MRRLICVLLLLLLTTVFTPVFGLSPEQELQKTQKELSENKKQLNKIKKEEQAVLGRLVVINKELKQTKQTLSRAQSKIKTNEGQIKVLSSELNENQSDLKSKESEFRKRVEEVYKGSSLSYLDLLFSANSMSDFFNRLYFFRKIIDYDATLVSEMRSDVNETRVKKVSLQNKTNQIKELAREITQKKQTIALKAEEKNKIYKSLSQRRKDYEAKVAELEKSSKDLEVLILKKVAGGKGTKVRGSGRLAWPLRGRITSRYGYRRHPLWGGRSFHTGLDIANKYGTPIKAADSGEIIFAGWWDGYGKAVVIDHGKKTTTVYAHMSRIYKQVGATVAKGQVVGLVGSTGYSTGPHLHFEVRKNGKPVNPYTYLK